MRSELLLAVSRLVSPGLDPVSRLAAEGDVIRAMTAPSPSGAVILPSSLSDAEADAVIDAILD